MTMTYLHFFHGCWKVVFNIMKTSNTKLGPRSEDDPYRDVIISEHGKVGIDFVVKVNVTEVQPTYRKVRKS